MSKPLNPELYSKAKRMADEKFKTPKAPKYKNTWQRK